MSTEPAVNRHPKGLYVLFATEDAGSVTALIRTLQLLGFTTNEHTN